MSDEQSEEPNQSSHVLWITVGLLVAAISMVALYKMQPILFPKISLSAEVDASCDLRSAACVSRIGDDIEVGFSIEPREIPVVKPLKFRVDVKGLKADKVEIDFSGVDMNMGYNRVTLQPGEARGVFEGGGMLPVCVWDEMEWEAKVLITTDQGVVLLPYRFITVRPGISLP